MKLSIFSFTFTIEFCSIFLRNSYALTNGNHSFQTTLPNDRFRNYVCNGSKGASVTVIDLDPTGRGSLPFPDDIQGQYVLFQHGYSQGVIYSSSELDVTNDIIVFIHGLEQNTDFIYRNIVSKLYDARPRADFLFVDWSEAAGIFNGSEIDPEWTYHRIVSNTRVVGGCLARWLEGNEYFDASRTYCIGLGLGDHICGFAGKTFTKLKWGRITALDPIENEFNLGSYSRVSRNDTEFLDVIHTSCLSYRLGIGHVDYFVNDFQKSQPGCPDKKLSCQGPASTVRQSSSSCSHLRSVNIYLSSIDERCCLSFCSWHSSLYCRQVGFWAYNYLYEKVGNFYGNLTAKKAPFCLFRAPAPCYAYPVSKAKHDAEKRFSTKLVTKWYEDLTTSIPEPEEIDAEPVKSEQLQIANLNKSRDRHYFVLPTTILCLLFFSLIYY